jgi:hypothetical protein
MKPIRVISFFPVPRASWVILAAILFAPSLCAQQVPLGQDTHAFRHVLKEAGLKPLASFAELEPKRTVVILLGKMERLDSFDVRAFLTNGGAVLVATDNPNQSHYVGRDFGVEIRGQLPLAANDPTTSYRGLPDCPFVQPLPAGEDTAIFRNLRHVATNQPAYLAYARQPNPLRQLAVLPYSFSIRRGGRLFDMPTAFAIGGRVGSGRVLILSDHSVFLNDMMLPRDNDNFEFAANVVEWLKEPGDGSPRRDRVLYVEEGTIRTDFEVKWKQVLVPPLPPPEDLLELGDQLVSGLEKEGYFRDLERRNVFNDTVLSEFGLNNILRGAALALTLGMLVYGSFRLMRGRHRFDAAPLFALALARSTPEGMAVEQRHQALLKQRNLWEPARDLARQCLEPALSKVSKPPAGAMLPPMVAQGNWWRRRSWRRRLERLWKLAYGPRPVAVSAREFTRLLEETEEVKEALHNGTVQLAEPIGNRRPT